MNKFKLCGPFFLLILCIQFSSCNTPDFSKNEARDSLISLNQGQEELGAEIESVRDFKGQHVVLNFWAGLCPACRNEMPNLEVFYKAHENELIFIGVDVGPYVGLGSEDDAKNLLSELSITYPAGFATDGNVVLDYKLLYMPTTLFISPGGKITKRFEGSVGQGPLFRYAAEFVNNNDKTMKP